MYFFRLIEEEKKEKEEAVELVGHSSSFIQQPLFFPSRRKSLSSALFHTFKGGITTRRRRLGGRDDVLYIIAHYRHASWHFLISLRECRPAQGIGSPSFALCSAARAAAWPIKILHGDGTFLMRFEPLWLQRNGIEKETRCEVNSASAALLRDDAVVYFISTPYYATLRPSSSFFLFSLYSFNSVFIGPGERERKGRQRLVQLHQNRNVAVRFYSSRRSLLALGTFLRFSMPYV